MQIGARNVGQYSRKGRVRQVLGSRTRTGRGRRQRQGHSKVAHGRDACMVNRLTLKTPCRCRLSIDAPRNLCYNLFGQAQAASPAPPRLAGSLPHVYFIGSRCACVRHSNRPLCAIRLRLLLPGKLARRRLQPPSAQRRPAATAGPTGSAQSAQPDVPPDCWPVSRDFVTLRSLSASSHHVKGAD